MKYLLYLTCSLSLILVCSALAFGQAPNTVGGRIEGIADRRRSEQQGNAAPSRASDTRRVVSSSTNNRSRGGKQPLEMREVRQLRVASVIDGDTIIVADKSGTLYQIRLQDIDAPELKQPSGEAAKAHLAELLEGKEVDLSFYGENALKQGATTNARVFVNGLDVGYEQLSTGNAWFVSKDKKLQGAYERKMYQEQEQNARQEKLGLWQDAAPQAPWEYRRTHQ